MKREGMTVRAAAEEWVREFNAIPQGVIEKLMQLDTYDVQEITPPAVNNRVYVTSGKHDGEYGDIVGRDSENDMYIVRLDSGDEIKLGDDLFEVEHDGCLPMWGTMWTFGDNIDNCWLEDDEQDGLRKMADCGFRIYEQEDLGYVFGIDGAGYSFFEEHWVPLYNARGLHWHDDSAEQEYQMTKKGYKKGKLGHKEYWVDDDENIIAEVI